MPIGDYDKRLVILTKEIGKISAFAKGARRQNSALLACSQPFAFGEFSLYAGRSSYTIMSCEISNYFPELRRDIESVYYGLYFCEVADYVTKENNDEKDILKLLYQSLRVVAKKTIPLSLVKVIYELKVTALGGEAPQVFQCVKCRKDSNSQSPDGPCIPQEGYSFSANCGGILCNECRVHDRGAVRLNTSTLYALQYIISKDVENLFTFTVTDEVLKELTLCVKEYLDCCIGHEFKALESIKSLTTE